MEGSDENAEPKPDKGAIESKLKGFKKDLEKAQRELDQKAKEKAVAAPAPGQPGDDRLAKRTDLTTPRIRFLSSANYASRRKWRN